MTAALLPGSTLPDHAWVIGVDLGGTKILVGAVPVGGGPPIGVCSAPTQPEEGAEAVIERLAGLVRETVETVQDAAAGPVVGIGLGSPGPLDRHRQVVVETPNLSWREVSLGARVRSLTGLPTTLDNDANCAAFGEWWRGAGQGFDPLVAVTLGTGVGGGIVLAGAPFHGASDVAGEFGHTVVRLGGRLCGCGNRGCIEAYASGPNIVARAREALEAGDASPSIEALMTDERLDAGGVFAAASDGDPLAQRIVEETVSVLGAGLANLVNLLNPSCIVLGGGVARVGAALLDPLREEVKRRAFASAAQACTILPAGLPETAGMVGAAGVFVHAWEAGLPELAQVP